MTAVLDDKDRTLLSLLQGNAREPVASLARQLGLARTTVVARIARLEKLNVIAGYGVRLGRAVETASVRAYCSISVRAQTGADVVATLRRWPEIEEVCAVSGAFDYLILLRCGDTEALDAMLDRIGQIDGVNRTQTSVVLSRKIDRRSAVH